MRRLPAGVFILTVGLVAAAAWFERSDLDVTALVVIGIWLATLSAVAGLVATRQPRNAVGWLLLAVVVTISVNVFVTAYAGYAVEVRPGSLPLGSAAAWASLWTSAPAAIFVPIALLMFPNGELLGRRWRSAVWIAVVAGILMMVGLAVKPGPVDSVRAIDNPVSFSGGSFLYGMADGPLPMILMGVILAAIASLFLRMARARGAERQQLKWFVYAVAVFPLFFGLGAAVDGILDAQLGAGDHYVDFLLMMLGALLIPVAMGVSILRYRLYDIDVIVNRTLVYGALTAMLAGAYLGIVVVLQRVLAPITADSDVVVAASTLAVAALFRPLRVRVQAFIDRRFYRRKYDAAETLSRFSSRLRDEIELDALSEDLISVVGETVQPSHASLWLRSEGAR